ncbi:hypothetical protein C3495_09090 [Clostridiaceae bacterium 14S0207]|nr:hypothetical protein C3495_09090 [Clostridiaceae bacterium 14S0207]
MFDGLYSEFLKLKKTGYYILILLAGLICLQLTTMNKELISQLNWYGYFFKFEVVAFSIFFTLVVPNIVATIFVREFRYNTATTLFCYSYGRIWIFINKFMISIIVTAILYVTSYIFVILGGVIFLKEILTIEPLINNLKIFLVSYIFQITLIPLTILVALVSKSMIICSIYSMILLIGNIYYLIENSPNNYIFSILPAISVAKLRTNICSIYIPIEKIISINDIYLGIWVFIIGSIGCILFCRKCNIY